MVFGIGTSRSMLWAMDALTRSFHNWVAPLAGAEQVDVFLQHRDVTIERIVSSGSQPPARYLQDHDEWVMLVAGEATLTLGGKPVSLQAGDTLHLPAGVEHEVLHTSAGAVWLAVHIGHTTQTA
jgi:cupin 2 domain-containing protein